MAVEVVLPKTNENMDEATIGRWHKSEGDRVKQGEPLVEVITDKATFQLEAPATGILRLIVIPEKSVIPVGVIIGLIGEEGEALPDVKAHNARLLDKEGDDLAAMASKALKGKKRVRSTPSARKLARKSGVELADVAEKMGIDGRISEEDVEAFLARREGENGG